MLNKQNFIKIAMGVLLLTLVGCGKDSTQKPAGNNGNANIGNQGLTPEQIKQKEESVRKQKLREEYIQLERQVTDLSKIKSVFLFAQSNNRLPSLAKMQADSIRLMYVAQEIRGYSVSQLKNWHTRVASNFTLQGNQIDDGELAILKQELDGLKSVEKQYPELIKQVGAFSDAVIALKGQYNVLHKYLMTGAYRLDDYQSFTQKINDTTKSYKTLNQVQQAMLVEYDKYFAIARQNQFAFLKKQGIEVQVAISELNDTVYHIDSLFASSVNGAGRFDPSGVDLKKFKEITDQLEKTVTDLERFSVSSPNVLKEFQQPVLINEFKILSRRLLIDLLKLQEYINMANFNQTTTAYGHFVSDRKSYNDYVNAIYKQLKGF